MASDVDICNLALSFLGDEANITGIDPPDGSTQADLCATYYPIARDQVLAEGHWGFAVRRKALVELADVDPPESWGYTYAEPNDCHVVIAVLLAESTDDDKTQEYLRESVTDDTQVIYTNSEDAVLRYVAHVTDSAKYPAHVVVAIARLLASYVAGPLIKGDKGMDVSDRQLKRYIEIDLPKAQSIDGNQRRRNTHDNFKPAALAARA